MSLDILSSLDFTRAAMHTLQAVPGVAVVGRDTSELYLEFEGRELHVQLANFYDQYRADPEALPLIMQALVDALSDLPPDRTTTDPALLLGRIMPMLKPLALLNEVREQQVPMLAYRPFGSDLMIAYVIDEGNSVAFVNENHLAAWHVDEPMLHRQALRNLRARPDPLRSINAGARSLLVGATDDGYAATRLLLPELFQPFMRQLTGSLVIGIPNRDFLIGFGDDDPVVFARIADQVAEDTASKPYPLTEQLFTIRNGSIQLYQQE